ncbi:MAG: hypothetical protein WAQ28_13395 [Bacteroidia bacterium]
MRKILLLSVIIGSCLLVKSQTIIVNQHGPNSEQTRIRGANAEYYTKETQQAISDKNLDKAKYYLQQWHAHGAINANFYILWADYYVLVGRPKTAKKLLMRAYRKKSCFECKQMAENIKG